MKKFVMTVWRVSHYWKNLKPLRHLLIFANVEGAEQTPRLITAYSTSVHIHPVDTQQRKHSVLVVYVYLMSFFALLHSLASSQMAASCCTSIVQFSCL